MAPADRWRRGGVGGGTARCQPHLCNNARSNKPEHVRMLLLARPQVEIMKVIIKCANQHTMPAY